jgi:hypothetical protein
MDTAHQSAKTLLRRRLSHSNLIAPAPHSTISEKLFKIIEEDFMKKEYTSPKNPCVIDGNRHHEHLVASLQHV